MSPTERSMLSIEWSRPWWWRGRIVVPVALALTAAALVVDGPAYHGMLWKKAADADWNRALRVMGYLPVWMVVAVILSLASWRGDWRTPLRRAVLLVGSAALGGGLAEMVKLLVRRQRPEDTDGAFVFVPFGEHTFDTGHFGFVSSHAGVAFGAAFALALLWPRAAGVFVLLACGCGLTRVLAGAHFVSDVAGAAAVGFAAAWVVAGLIERVARAEGRAQPSSPSPPSLQERMI